MTLITPSSGAAITDLEDDEPYRGTLRKPKDGWYSAGLEQYGGKDRLVVDWLLEDGVSTQRDWISLALGKQQNGTVSKLRMLLNALSEKPRDTEIKWFLKETLEWGYADYAIDPTPFNKLTEGMEVLFRGVNGTKQDGSGKFTIQKYGSAASAKTKPSTKAKPAAAAEAAPF